MARARSRARSSCGCLASRPPRRSRGLFTAKRLRYVSAGDVAEWFRADSEPIGDPERRAALWRDLASGLERDYGGSAAELLDQRGRAAGRRGRPPRAASSPIALTPTLWQRRRSCSRRSPSGAAGSTSWTPGPGRSRPTTSSCGSPSARGSSAPGSLGRGPLRDPRGLQGACRQDRDQPTGPGRHALGARPQDPDLLGNAAGELSEPPRDPSSAWY